MKKILCAILSSLLVIGNTSLVHAEETETADEGGTILESFEVDPSTLNVQKIGQIDDEIMPEDGSIPYSLDDIVRVSIVLDEDSATDAGYSMNEYSVNQAVMNYEDRLRTQQDIVTERIETAINKKLDVVWNLTLAVNIISANVTYGDIVKIRKVSGVSDVFVENRYEALEETAEPDTANTSEKMVGAVQTWNSLGYSGAGTRVAIIDTGIDTDHQSFNADALTYSVSKLGKTGDLVTQTQISSVLSRLNGKSGKYFNAKIPFGYNYCDRNTTINHLSDTEGEHGSHVAGIAAANKYIKDGSSYVLASDAVKAVGMAPDAQLYVMKVFGANGGAYDSDYFSALEDAIRLECDTVNLSLGGAAPGFTYASSTYQTALNKLSTDSSLKLVVSISAGNSGAFTDHTDTELYIDDTDQHTGGSPGTYLNSLCVAAAQNTADTGMPMIFNGNQNVFFTQTSGSGADMSTIAGTYSYVYIDSIGDAADYKAVNSAESLRNKVVIVNRGELNFVDKAKNAVSYSPKAVLVANNQPGSISMAMSGYTGSFPVASITFDSAQGIIQTSTRHTTGSYTYYTGTVIVTDSVVSILNKNREDTVMAEFSSWGVPGSLIMKPEITAPGGSIYSVFGKNYTEDRTYAGGSDQYELMSGTSMSAPHIAGLSALVAQRVNDLKTALNNKGASLPGYSLRAANQSLLMSTATPMINDGQYVSILQQGAGLVDVYKAASANTMILMDTNDGTLTAKTGAAQDGKVKAEIGDNPTRTADYTYSFTINNMNDQEVEYELSTDLFTQDHFEENGSSFLSRTTDAIRGWRVFYTADGIATVTHDANLDGITDEADVQAILDYVTYTAAGKTYEPFSAEEADMDNNNVITSYDAYQLIKWLESGEDTAALTVAAHGSKKVNVRIRPNSSLDQNYPSGAYVEGYTYINPVSVTSDGVLVDDVEHSIPILGFYGSWTDPNMFDEHSYGDNGTSYMTVTYIGSSSANSVTGNPYAEEETFPYDRLALSSSTTIDTFVYSLLRTACFRGFAVALTDRAGGNITEVLATSNTSTGTENGLYYNESTGKWVTKKSTVSINKTVSALSDRLTDGTTFRIGYYAVPEYNAIRLNSNATSASSGNLTSASFQTLLKNNVLGTGSMIGYDFTVDDTAPVIGDVVLNGDTVTVEITDNANIAYAAVMSNNSSTTYLSTIPGNNQTTLSFDISLTGESFTVFAGDYAGNETARRTGTSGSTESYYVLTNTLTAGNDYLIVSSNSTGNAYALGHSGTSAVTDSLTIVSSGNQKYISESDVDSTSVWTASGSTYLKNGNYYLSSSNKNLTFSQTASQWTWDSTNNRLYQTSGWRSYYLRYSNGSFSLNTTAASVYLFVRTDTAPSSVSEISEADTITEDVPEDDTAEAVNPESEPEEVIEPEIIETEEPEPASDEAEAESEEEEEKDIEATTDSEPANETTGSLNNIKDYEPVNKQHKAAEPLIRTFHMEKPEGEREGTEFNVIINKESGAHNGLYSVAYDPAKITFVENIPGTKYGSHCVDEENGVVYFAYADNEITETAGEVDKVVFSSSAITVKAIVTEIENNETEIISETEEVVMGAADYEAIIINGCSLSLRGDIGINYYLDIPEDTAKAAVIWFEYNGNTISYLPKDIEKTSDGYKITITVTSEEMREPIHLWVEDSDGSRIKLFNYYRNAEYTYTGYTYTVERYFNIVRANPETYADLQNLVNAMDDYGKYAQKYFQHGDYENLIPVNDISDITTDTVSSFATRKTAMPDGLSYYGSNLILKTNTTYQQFFILDNNYDINDYTFTANGAVKQPVLTPEGYYKLEYPDISATDLGKDITVAVTRKGTETVGTITNCPMTYVYNTLISDLPATTQELKDLCRALYKYYVEADAYFSTH